MKFTLGSKTSDELDIALLSTPKPLQSGVSGKVTNLEGQIGGIDYGGELTPLVFQLNCEFKNATTEAELQNRIRALADHLFDVNGEPVRHELSFSDEPDKYWTVRYISGRGQFVERMVGGTIGRFTLRLIAEDPTAHEAKESTTVTITTSGESVEVTNSGNIKTPLKIKVKNEGSDTINGFKIQEVS